MQNEIFLTKLDAATSQLDTAIYLWFLCEDPISVHTLASAAYQIIHDIKTAKGIVRDLLLDTLWIKDEFIAEFRRNIRRPANFFKHADRDPNAKIVFNTMMTDFFLLFACFGLELMKIEKSKSVRAFLSYYLVQNPGLLTEKGRLFYQPLAENIQQYDIDKQEFYKSFLEIAP